MYVSSRCRKKNKKRIQEDEDVNIIRKNVKKMQEKKAYVCHDDEAVFFAFFFDFLLVLEDLDLDAWFSLSLGVGVWGVEPGGVALPSDSDSDLAFLNPAADNVDGLSLSLALALAVSGAGRGTSSP